MTAGDFVFWFEDIYSNKDILPVGIADMTPNGKPGKIVKVDDYTVNFVFDVPFYLFEDLMGGDAYAMWQYGSGSTETDKNLHYLQAIDGDPTASAAIAPRCVSRASEAIAVCTSQWLGTSSRLAISPKPQLSRS